MYIWINHYHRRYVVIFTKMYLRQPSTVSLCQNELYSYKVNSVMRHPIVPLKSKSQRQEMIQYHSETVRCCYTLPCICVCSEIMNTHTKRYWGLSLGAIPCHSSGMRGSAGTKSAPLSPPSPNHAPPSTIKPTNLHTSVLQGNAKHPYIVSTLPCSSRVRRTFVF